MTDTLEINTPFEMANEALDNLRKITREIQKILDSNIFPETTIEPLRGTKSFGNEFKSAMIQIMQSSAVGRNADALPLVWSQPSNLAKSSQTNETVGEALDRGLQSLEAFWEKSSTGHIDNEEQSEALENLASHLENAETAYEIVETYVQKHPAATNG